MSSRSEIAVRGGLCSAVEDKAIEHMRVELDKNFNGARYNSRLKLSRRQFPMYLRCERYGTSSKLSSPSGRAA
jgi:hypothetical protein